MGEALYVDMSDIRELIKDLNFLDKKSGRRVSAAMKRASGKILQDARSNASWSSRIPSSISISATQKLITIKSGGPKAPHGGYYESGHDDRDGAVVFAHLVFGKKVDKSIKSQVAANGYILEPTKPYLRPARDANLELFAQALADAIADTITMKG